MEPCIILKGMRTTTRKQPNDSTRVSVREVRGRLKVARARNLVLKQAGKLPPPTKSWSEDSVKSLQIALSAGASSGE